MAMVEKTNKKTGKSNYFKDVGKELRKVNYPSVATVRRNTLIVIVLSIIVGIFIAALDFGFGEGARALLQNRAPATESNIVYDENGEAIGITNENGEFIPLSDLIDENATEEDHEDHTGHNH